MGSKQCNSIKAIEGQHATSPKIREHQGGAPPLSPTWNMGVPGEFMGGEKGGGVSARPKLQSYLIIPQKKQTAP